MSEQNKKPQDLKDTVYSREEYARPNFWEERYVEKGGFFDWYAEFPQLKVAFDEYDIAKEDRILMVGCGNSKLSDQMYQNGYKNIVNIDISSSVIEQMRGKFPYMVWEVMDATKMDYPDGQFDVIIDKGTLDALISGKSYDVCEAMLHQCVRVTKQQGQLILITYGSPEGRRKIFENALPFEDYDYYQCRAELNDFSTMINLMRSNLPGEQLSNILKQKQVFARTMKEFTIIQMMRRSRKNQKQYIVWNKYQKAEIQINNSHIQQQQPQQTKETTNLSNSEKQKQEFSYQPKKQPYVFVYSIKRKFTLGIQKEELAPQSSKNQFGDIELVGSQGQAFTFLLKENLHSQALKGARFAISKKQIVPPAILITASQQRVIQKSVRLNIIESKDSQFLCLRKSNFNIKIGLTPKIKVETIISQLSKLPRKLIDKCNLHPSPQVYSLFSALKDRKILPSINELLQKYWYPTWRINSLSKEQLTIEFSIPPLVNQRQVSVIGVAQNCLKGLKIAIGQVRKGFICFTDIMLYNIASMACLSYSSERAAFLIEEFWDGDLAYEELNRVQGSQYNQIGQTLLTSGAIVDKVVAHIVALY